MLNLKAKPFNQVLEETPELRTNGEWVCLNVDTRTAWPTTPQAFAFEGHQAWVMPLTTDHYPGLAAIKPADMDRDQCFALLHRALSVLAWLQDTGAVVVHMSGGNLPRMMGTRQPFGYAIRDEFDLSDLPVVGDASGKLALALMREGRGLNHPGYSFLSFFRALETAIPNGKARGAWITESIDRLEGHRAKEALDKLKAAIQGDIGKHLRESGRHAIAHAQADPIINPDDPRDARRLEAELPIIEALAVLAIEEHLGIQTRHKAWQEHLYELRGWKSIIPAAVIKASLVAEPNDIQANVDLPLINFRLRRSEPFPLLEGMAPVHVGMTNQRVDLVYRSADGLAEIIFWLNFAEERLEFDLDRSFNLYDDGTASAARNGKERCRFIWDYFGNGEIQIWDADTGKLISRVDAFLPLNMMANLDGHIAELAAWDKLIADREQAEGSVG
jgi:Methylamine utilization protein MauJ